MAQPPSRERTLREMATPDFTYESLCIQYPDEGVPYVLKTELIHLLPKFHGLAGEDPHKHLIKGPFVYIGLGLCCVLIVFRLLSLTLSTAEPPRKDGGDLLLSKLFLDACSSVYAVFPGGQENQGQPFVSKHFNVIDPLRVNNNLGRSVSKGVLVSKHLDLAHFICLCYYFSDYNLDLVHFVWICSCC